MASENLESASQEALETARNDLISAIKSVVWDEHGSVYKTRIGGRDNPHHQHAEGGMRAFEAAEPLFKGLEVQRIGSAVREAFLRISISKALMNELQITPRLAIDSPHQTPPGPASIHNADIPTNKLGAIAGDSAIAPRVAPAGYGGAIRGGSTRHPITKP